MIATETEERDVIFRMCLARGPFPRRTYSRAGVSHSTSPTRPTLIASIRLSLTSASP